MTTAKKTGKPRRETLTIALADDVNQQLNTFLSKYGTRGLKIGAVGRLIQWFIQQPEPFKQVILGWHAEGLEKSYAKVLRDLADQLDGKAEEHVLHLRSSRPPKSAQHAEP